MNEYLCEKNIKCFDYKINITKCIDKMKPGYFIDLKDGIYKPCYKSCISCNSSGDIYNKNCIEYWMDKQLEQIHVIMENFNTTDIDSGTNFVQIEEDIIITISSIYNQQHNTYTNISSIDFGDCEGNINKKYNLPQNSTIFVLKIDVFIAGNKIPKVEYELYYPFNGKNFTLLDISVCENDVIDIYIPINISSDELGKYDPESDFYNDVCTLYTSENGTDKPLVDRREDFINNNLTICEEDCSVSMYDESQNKVKCSCLIKTKIPLLSDIKIKIEKYNLHVR